MDFYSILSFLKDFIKSQNELAKNSPMPKPLKEVLSFRPDEEYISQHPSVLKLLADDLVGFSAELKKNQTNIEADHIYIPLMLYLKIYLVLATFETNDIIKNIGAFPENGILAFLEGIPLFFQSSPSRLGFLKDQLLKETREVLSYLSKALRLNKIPLLSSEALLIFEGIIDSVYLNKNLPGTLENTHLKTLTLIGVECWLRLEKEKEEAQFHLFKVIRERSIDKTKVFLVLDNGDRIHFLSYVILQYYQQKHFVSRVRIDIDKEDDKLIMSYSAIEDIFKQSGKEIKSFVVSLLKLCDEDYKKASRLFTAAFLKDCVTCCGDSEIQVSSVIVNLFTLVLAHRFSDKKKSSQNIYNFLIDDILQVLIFNIKNKFVQNTKNLNQLKEAFQREKPSKGYAAVCKKCKYFVLIDSAYCSADSSKENGLCVLCYIRAFSDGQSGEGADNLKPKRSNDSPGPLNNRVEPLIYRWSKENDPFFVLIALEDLNNRFIMYGDDYHCSRQYYLSKLTQNTRILSNNRSGRNKTKDKRLQVLIESYWDGGEPKISVQRYKLNDKMRGELTALSYFIIDLEQNYDSLYKLLFYLSDHDQPSMRARILQIFLSMFNIDESVSPTLDISDIIDIRRNDKSEVVRVKVIEVLIKIIANNWDPKNKYCMNMIDSLNDVSPVIRRKILEFLLEVLRREDNKHRNIFSKEEDEPPEHPAPFTASQLCSIVERVYNDVEEISEIAIEILARILFASFKKDDQRPKKKAKATSVSKSAGKSSSNNDYNTKRNWLRLGVENRVDLFCGVFTAIKEDIKTKNKRKRVGKLINEWFESVLECDRKTRGEDKSEVKMLVSALLDRILQKKSHDPSDHEREQDLIRLEILQNFSKYYPEVFFEELAVLTRCLDISCATRKKLLKGSEGAISDTRDCILLICEILQATLKVKDFVMTKILVDRWQGIEKNLEELIYSEPLLILHESAKLLSLSCRKITLNYQKISFIQKNLENYIESIRAAFTKTSPEEFLNKNTHEKENLKRCLYLQAIFTKYFSFELETDSSLQSLEDYIDDLKFFIRIQHPDLEPTCVECLTMLWEIQPFLVFESKTIIDRYLRPPTGKNDVNMTIVRQIFIIFYNLLQKNELNVKAILKERKNAVNEERENFLKNQKTLKSVDAKPSTAKKFLEMKEQEEQAEEIQPSTSAKSSENSGQNLNNISQMIREFTRPAFAHHILRKEKHIRLAVLNVLNSLISQGLMSSFEICGHLVALICDSELEIRKKTMNLLKSEWSAYPQNIFLNLEKGFRYAFNFVKIVYGIPRAHFFDPETGASRGFFEELNEEMNKTKLKSKVLFPLLNEKLMDSIDKITLHDEAQLDYLLFLGEILLTLVNWRRRDLFLMAKGLLENATAHVHKVQKALKEYLKTASEKTSMIVNKENVNRTISLGEQVEESIGMILLEHEESAGIKEKMLSEGANESGIKNPNKLLLLQSFGVVTYLTLSQLLLVNAGKDILGKDMVQSGQYTLKEYIEKAEKKIMKEDSVGAEPEDEGENSKAKNIVFNATMIEKFREFANDILMADNYTNDIQSVYHLYKKIKQLYYGEVYVNYDIILGFGKSLEKDLEQEPTHDNNKRQKGKAKGQRAPVRIPRAHKGKNASSDSEDEGDNRRRADRQKYARTAEKEKSRGKKELFVNLEAEKEVEKEGEAERLEEARQAATEYKKRLRRKNDLKYVNADSSE